MCIKLPFRLTDQQQHIMHHVCRELLINQTQHKRTATQPSPSTATSHANFVFLTLSQSEYINHRSRPTFRIHSTHDAYFQIPSEWHDSETPKQQKMNCRIECWSALSETAENSENSNLNGSDTILKTKRSAQNQIKLGRLRKQNKRNSETIPDTDHEVHR